jgi:hypothetical protein
MKPRDHGNGIIFYEHGLSDELCDTIWSFYYNNFDLARPGVTISGKPLTPDGERWKNTMDQEGCWDDSEAGASIKTERSRIDELIYQELRPVISEYLGRFKYLAEAPGITDTGYLWQMYKKNDGYYREHVDGQQWVYRVHRRVGAIVCYVNTVEEGGETYFPYQNLKVKPEKGGVVVFPAHWMYPHESLLTISSDKLILSSFLECNTEFHVHEN